jgi:DNA polymerase elongation subunit (family B)
VKLFDRYTPDFYAEPRGMEAGRLAGLLEEHDDLAGASVERRLSSIREMREVEVVRVRVARLEDYRRVLAQVEALPCVAGVYDADVEHELKYLCDRGLAPMGRVAVEADELRRIRRIAPIPEGLEVEPPPIRVLRFGVDLDGEDGTVTTFNPRLGAEYVFRGPTRRVLRDFLDHFADVDPDVVACRERDLASVLRLGRRHGLRRFGTDSGGEPKLYGGRAHVSLSTYGRLALSGLVERVRYTRLPARLSSEWGAGRAIETRQCYEARRRGILVPRRGGFQPVMTLEEMLRRRDQGGLIFAPDVGLHENAAALDFESMFPNIIVKRNVSYENIRLGREREGFLVDFTRETLERRLHFKRLRREFRRDSDEWLWCEGRQLALKEILFCTYGYSGCWANRFGNFDTFMEINRVARETLVESMGVAREAGFRVVYGNNDSLFLKRPGATRDDYEGLAGRIADRVGLPMAVENHFRFLVLLPQKGDRGIGAVNRYYGRTAEGGHVCRGIELRRRDTPPYVARVQREAIEALLRPDSVEGVRTEGLRRALEVIDGACRRLRLGEVPHDQLRASTVLRKEPGEYKARLPHVAAAEALGMAGARVEAGSLVDYVYVDAGHSNPFRRVRPAALGRGVDVEKYVELVREAGRSVLMPFGVDLEAVDGVRPTRLSDFAWPAEGSGAPGAGC